MNFIFKIIFFSEDENEQQETSVSSGMKLPFADRLDVMMAKLFDYIRSNCYKDVNDKSSLDWEKCRSIYKDLLFIFDKYILQTYGSSHVQFLLFYICSFRNLLAEGFLGKFLLFIELVSRKISQKFPDFCLFSVVL